MSSDQHSVTPANAIQIALDNHRAGRLPEAEKIYRRVLEVEPDNTDALYLLGTVALQVGKHALAVEFIGKALVIKPDFSEAHFNLGIALKELGQPDAAVASYLKALAVNPGLSEAHNNLGIVLQELDRPDEAMASYRQAFAIKPDYAEAHNNLGFVLKQQGRLAEAVVSYRKAIEIKPDFAAAHNDLGFALQEQGKLDEAIACYRNALAIQPDLAQAHNNLGIVHLDQGRIAEAVACFHRALAIDPRYADAHNNLGIALKKQGRLAEAVTCFDTALSIEPDFARAHNNLGNALQDQCKLDEAMARFQKALAIDPNLAETHSNAIFLLDLMEGCGVREQQEERRRWFALHGRTRADAISPYDNAADRRRKLRIGYVSANFRRHAASYAFGPIIRLHERRAFEVVCYSGVTNEDDVTARLRLDAEFWRSTVGVSDADLAAQIRRDRIDILVDLSAHMAGNRLLTFARRPAPVQVTAWGYPNGTGMPTVDYLFADRVVIPAGERGLFAEEVIDLPCFICYAPPEYLPDISPLPALTGRPFTFGCICRIEKISPGTLRLWGRLFAALPGAHLLIKGQALEDAEHRSRFASRLGDAGIGPERVRLIGHTTHVELLRLFHEVDLCLDPFPHGGAIGTAEALWMGVPVVTLSGATFMSRISASILTALEMTEWIAGSHDEYLRIAVQAAQDLAGLARVRAALRSRLNGSVFGDVLSYTRAVEAAYRVMWRRWCEER